MAEPRIVWIGSSGLSAGISAFGAELQWLRDAEGRDLLWDGDPAFWTGRAPILFPVIGCVAGGIVRVDGHTYPMAKHGFARAKTWQVADETPDRVTFRLVADDETRASYPFDFRLDLSFALDGASLTMTAELHNPGDRMLPASFGFHPALRWPLPGGDARADTKVIFAADEPAPIRRIDAAGLLRPRAEPSPVGARTLALDDALFVEDALIFDDLGSRSLLYGGGGRSLAIAFPDMPQLGIWTKPGAGYLCIEPWAGFADPEGYAGELTDKPGVVHVGPAETRCFTMRLTLSGH